MRAIRQTKDGVELDLFIAPELAQFDGHFPGVPIVPGVAQVDWAVKMSARYLGLAIEVAHEFQVKFRRIATANSSVTLVLRHRASLCRIDFTYRTGDEVLTSGSISLCEPS